MRGAVVSRSYSCSSDQDRPASSEARGDQQSAAHFGTHAARALSSGPETPCASDRAAGPVGGPLGLLCLATLGSAIGTSDTSVVTKYIILPPARSKRRDAPERDSGSAARTIGPGATLEPSGLPCAGPRPPRALVLPLPGRRV